MSGRMLAELQVTESQHMRFQSRNRLNSWVRGHSSDSGQGSCFIHVCPEKLTQVECQNNGQTCLRRKMFIGKPKVLGKESEDNRIAKEFNAI